MAAWVQQHNALLRQSFKCRQHTVKIYTTSFVIEIWVEMSLDASAIENRNVVIPSWLAYPNI
ncbi:hypothetical protein D9M71_695540 [compost metagenome]